MAQFTKDATPRNGAVVNDAVRQIQNTVNTQVLTHLGLPLGFRAISLATSAAVQLLPTDTAVALTASVGVTGTLYLPKANSVPVGWTVSLYVTAGAYSVSASPQSTDQIYGSGFFWTSDGVSKWYSNKITSPNNNDWLNVRNYGATGNGTTDDSSAFASAVAAIGSGSAGVVYVPAGSYKIGTAVSFDGRTVYITGDGAASVLLTTGSNAILTWTEHNRAHRIENLSFQPGAGIGCYANCTTSNSVYYDYTIDKCSFFPTTGTGVYLSGTREGLLHDCRFDYNTSTYEGVGVYLTASVNVSLAHCKFYHMLYGVQYVGTYTGFDAGLRATDCWLLNNSTAFEIDYVDWFSIKDSIIDFNTIPINILGTQQGDISGNFISSYDTVHAANATNPCISIGPGGSPPSHNPSGYSANIRITNNVIEMHEGSATSTLDAIYIAGCDGFKIHGNHIINWAGYGIYLDNSTLQNSNWSINDNFIKNNSTYGHDAMSETGSGATQALFTQNQFSQPVVTNAHADFNPLITGEVGSARNTFTGTGTITAGTTSVTIAHNLNHTVSNVQITPTTSNMVGLYWVDTFTSSHFNANITGVLIADASFTWTASDANSILQVT